MSIQLADIQKFFFYAMMQGYAGNAPKAKAPGMPGYKEIDVISISESWRCLDRYCVTPLSNKSAGTITICCQNDSGWVLHYGGEYSEEVIDFLKIALRANYEKEIFLGCRGPEYMESQDGKNLCYTNSLFEGSKTFAAFNGFESIRDLDNRLLGYHGYMGMSLLP